MDVSAVILSAEPVTRAIAGVEVVPFVSQFRDAAGLLDARLASLRAVRTRWFFWLDDDDELPEDYADVLRECCAVGTPLAYTDELVAGRVRKSEPYSQQAFIRNPLLIHHLAVCETTAARRAATLIPRGTYAVENLLFFQVAKQGATYVPRVGYVWNRDSRGLHRHPSLLIGQVQSASWAARHLA